MIFLFSQFPSVVVTGHVLRELKQVSAGSECPSRPWRARAKSDLQLGGPDHPAAVPPACQGALALSGVLRRLQQVEDKILQVMPRPLPFLCLCLGCLPLPTPARGYPSLAVHSLFSFPPVWCERQAQLTASLPLLEVAIAVSVTISFFLSPFLP